ncbi:hypothetical protein [Paraburkholderia humisilvae]|uniref:Uncharacterized protein n=1 Tax=Paraburkholderia humisilvae TaxID=627669 RepID=A0A6J5D5B7_9BURK|nr:hypothetical protein [Paraburkholderia humisilvae]CAB3748165.1 hypothetical protein LMG29542_00652 [Paraburkholderia humisilvae]
MGKRAGKMREARAVRYGKRKAGLICAHPTPADVTQSAQKMNVKRVEVKEDGVKRNCYLTIGGKRNR